MRNLLMTIVLLVVSVPAFAEIGKPDTDAEIAKWLARPVGHFSNDSSLLLYRYWRKLADTQYLPRLLEILDRALEGGNDARESLDIHRVALAIALTGEEKALQHLLLKAAEQSDSYIREALVGPVSEAWILREIRRVSPQGNPTAGDIPASQPALPEHLRLADPSLQEAWRRYQTLIGAYKAEFEQGGAHQRWIAFQKNEALFYQHVERFLRGNTQGVMEALAKFEWSGGCGTGSEALYGPRYRTCAMALLKAGRYRPAFAALMWYETRRFPRESLLQEPSWRPALARLCGEDWEQLYVGAVCSQTGSDYLGMLVEQGTIRTARYLIAMDSADIMPQSYLRGNYLGALAAFVPPGPPSRDSVGFSTAYERAATEPIPDDVIKSMLDIICRSADPGGDKEVFESAARILIRLCRPDTEAALRRIYASPYPFWQQRAMRALRTLGVQVAEIADPGPVTFRLTAAGEPLRNANVAWELSSGKSSWTSTSNQGTLVFDRSQFIDPGNPITEIVCRTSRFTSLGSDYFTAVVKPPKSNEQTVDVPITIAPLTLRFLLDGDRQVYRGSDVRVLISGKIRQAGKTSPGYLQPISEMLTGKVTEQLLVGRLTPGPYRLNVFVPGAGLWQSGEVNVTDAGTTLDVALEPGADLTFSLLAPGGGALQDKDVQYEISRDGKTLPHYLYHDYRSTKPLHRGLPAGRYVLKVFSSQEKLERLNRFEHSQIEPAMPRYHGREIPFTVAAGGPPLIDLGTINLEPLQGDLALQRVRRPQPARAPAWVNAIPDRIADILMKKHHYAKGEVWGLARRNPDDPLPYDEMGSSTFLSLVKEYNLFDRVGRLDDAARLKALHFWQSWQDPKTGRFKDPRDPKREVNEKYVVGTIGALGGKPLYPWTTTGTEMKIDTRVFLERTHSDPDWEQGGWGVGSHTGYMAVEIFNAINNGQTELIPDLEKGLEQILTHQDLASGLWGPPSAELMRRIGGNLKVIGRLYFAMGMKVPHTKELADTLIANSINGDWFKHGEDSCVPRNVAEVVAYCLEVSDYRHDELLAVLDRLVDDYRHWVNEDGSTLMHRDRRDDVGIQNTTLYALGLIGAYLHWDDCRLPDPLADKLRGTGVRYRPVLQADGKVKVVDTQTTSAPAGAANAAPKKKSAAGILLNQKDDGYRGIWYMNQPSHDEYVYKYSGGLGTYCANHIPHAMYSAEVDKTFFTWGGTGSNSNTHLLHMVSYYDHKTGMVPRPTVVLDKQTSDAHDNPVLSIDAQGYLWIFSSSHGTVRESYISRSTKPYSIDEFRIVWTGNFSYPQPWYFPGQGFLFMHTFYDAGRTICMMTSTDGVNWSQRRLLSRIDEGHYQVSRPMGPGRIGTSFMYHPKGKGLNWRTNLYYMESDDFGATWKTADGKALDLPLTAIHNPAMVHDYEKEGLLVYIQDINHDAQGRPVILYTTSKGFESGPKNSPRTWTTAHWTGTAWDIAGGDIVSDSNYDTGSLYVENDELWRIIGPTQDGPQAFNPGGEVAMWTSRDQGHSWKMTRALTSGSEYNHSYVRRPVNAHPDFYAFWADGHARQPSDSRLYFCNQKGDVFRLPTRMSGDFEKPQLVKPALYH